MPIREELDRSLLLDKLLLDLNDAASDYDKDADPDSRRAAALQQLMRITLCLTRLGIPHEALRPTTAIVHAIADIDRGKPPQILKRQKKGEDQRIPFEHMAQRGLAAAAVTLFFEADGEQGAEEKKLERALKKVAIRIRSWPAVAHRSAKRNGPQSMVEPLRDWRNSAMAGGPQDIDHSTYSNALRMRAETAHSPISWAEWLLTHGIKLYR